MSTHNIWLPQANAALSNPSEYDFHKDVWTGEIQASRKAHTFLPRLVKNARIMFEKDGSINRSVDFLVTGKVGSEKHMKGDRITGTQRNSISRRITVDDRPNRVAITDEHITRRFEQIDFRMNLFDNLAFGLAARAESEVMKQIALAARTPAVGNESTTEFLRGGNFMFNGGDVLVPNSSGSAVGYTADFGFDATNISSYTPGQANAKALAKALKTISIGWAKRSVRPSSRWCIIPTELFYDFVELEVAMPTQTTTVGGGIFGNFDIAGPKMPFSQFIDDMQPVRYLGFNILPHIFFDAEFVDEIPAFRGDHTNDPDRPGDFTSTIGVAFQSEAIGWADIMQTGINIERPELTTDEVAWAMTWYGSGTLDPVAAVELKQSV